MIKLAHKVPQECGNGWTNRNVVMALHDIIELKNFCQYWSKDLSDSYGFIVAVRLEVFLSFCLSLSLYLSFSFPGSGHV